MLSFDDHQVNFKKRHGPESSIHPMPVKITKLLGNHIGFKSVGSHGDTSNPFRSVTIATGSHGNRCHGNEQRWAKMKHSALNIREKKSMPHSNDNR
jgi:hypothetical protein